VAVPESPKDHSDPPKVDFRFLVPEAAACFWAVYARCWDAGGAFSALTSEPPSSLSFFEAASFETNAKENQQIRVSRSFYGAPWQDGVIVQVRNRHKQHVCQRRARGAVRQVTGPDRTQVSVAYAPDKYRNFGLVHLLFSFDSRLWMLVEILDGANNNTTRKKAPWADPIIPNWPRLKTRTQRDGQTPVAWTNRLDIMCIETAESVVCIVRDPAQKPQETPAKYWCALDQDAVPFDEIFDPDSPYQIQHTSATFDDAVMLQPSDLVPVSKFQQKDRQAHVRRADAARAANLEQECEQAAGELSEQDTSGTDTNSMSDDEG
jgi:hypothetical protein